METTESRHDKFRRLARSRGNRILRDLELLGNLANRNNYEYTPDEVRLVFAAIDEELKVTKQRFSEKTQQSRREIIL